MQLPLVNRGPLVVVQKLNWILDGDNVAVLLRVDLVKQGCQGGRLS